MVQRGASRREILLRFPDLGSDWAIRRVCAEAGVPQPATYERERHQRLLAEGLHWCGRGPDEWGHIVPVSEAPSAKRKSSTCKTCNRVLSHMRTYSCTWAESWAFITEPQRCAICGATENIVQDHCHRSGSRRDALFSNCNTGLGMFQDRAQTVLNAFMYLSTHAA